MCFFYKIDRNFTPTDIDALNKDRVKYVKG